MTGQARAASDPKRFARRFLPNFPNKAIIVKMEQARCGNNASEDTLDRLDFKTGVEITERAVGENKTDVQPHQRTAPPKNKTHEPTDGAVLFHPVAIVNPDQGKVLHVMKNFEQRDAGENIGNAVIAVPPKAERGD